MGATSKGWQHDGKSYIDDATLDRLPLGNAAVYGRWLVKDRDEAKMLVFDFLCALTNGKEITPRQYAFVAWILGPVLDNDHPNQLPFKLRGKGQRKPRRPTFPFAALAVHRLRQQGMARDGAIAEIATNLQASEGIIRGLYQRRAKTSLDAELKASENMATTIRAMLSQHTK